MGPSGMLERPIKRSPTASCLHARPGAGVRTHAARALALSSGGTGGHHGPNDPSGGARATNWGRQTDGRWQRTGRIGAEFGSDGWRHCLP